MGSTTVETNGEGLELSSVASVTNDLSPLGPNAQALDQQTHPGDQDYQILATDRYVSTDQTLTSQWTWALPAASSVPIGFQIRIADAFGACNLTTLVTVAPLGADTINKVTAARLVNSPYGYMKVASDGVSNWTVIDQFPLTGTPLGDVSYQMLATDSYVYTTAAFSAGQQWNLPAANAVATGWEITVSDAAGILSSSTSLIVHTAGSDTIDGTTGVWELKYAYAFAVLRSDGVSNWAVLGWFSASPFSNRIPDGSLASLVLQTNFWTRRGTIALANGRNDNVAMTKAWMQVSGPSAVFSLSGVAPVAVVAGGGTVDGEWLTLYNTTLFAMTLLHENANSTATNRLHSPSSADVVVGAGGSASLIYDGNGLGRWVLQNVYDGTHGPLSTVTAPQGGTGQSSYAVGDILYASGTTTLSKLATGTVSQVLRGGNTPSWVSQDGWISDPNTWTYASGTSFTIAGVDATGYLPKGTKISYNDGAVDYGHVASVSFSTNTTVTLITNTNYSIANAALSAPRYSYAESPQAFPTWFNWTPTLTGFTAAEPTSSTYQYHCVGTACHVNVTQDATGTSNANTFRITMPVTALNTCNTLLAVTVDGGTAQTTPGRVVVSSTVGLGTAVLFKDTASAVWTTSLGKRGCFQIVLPF